MLCSSRASIGRTYGIRFSQFGFSVNNSRTFLDLSGMQLKKGLFTFSQLILDVGIVKTSRAFMTLTKKWIFWPKIVLLFLRKMFLSTQQLLLPSDKKTHKIIKNLEPCYRSKSLCGSGSSNVIWKSRFLRIIKNWSVLFEKTFEWEWHALSDWFLKMKTCHDYTKN